ncbi:uncharacterized protein Z518_00955 [Rhinocladiella mackenziei CBS 650.93]|uniref:Uncharacterized protein n=1 Tax=Rhinocladiella mackenziei CBS 650.93 TaxID=1442369 RepID=A0A0D2IUV5_9EURO|nr:uncharacterized protein Z518_00955 [Rhinocladiella mackenziei CBS 650.93]KIX09874.1 hypothetical protein Z518_00955 [Rhinocladiella mackenziei CBS 650.93]
MRIDVASLTHALIRGEKYFTDELVVRKHLEARVQVDPSLGYTQAVPGYFQTFFEALNLRGLSGDKRSALYLRSPDAKISTTNSNEQVIPMHTVFKLLSQASLLYLPNVAKLIVVSLLPYHLFSLNMRRHIRFAGSTIPTSPLFGTVAYILNHPVNVTYETLASSFEYEKKQKEAGNEFPEAAGKFFAREQ